MPGLTLEQLFAECPPRRNLGDVIGQYDAQIRQLAEQRKGSGPPKVKHAGSEEMASLVESRLRGQRNIVTFDPFELLSRIHKVVYGKDDLGNNTEQIVSLPIHFGPDEDSFKITTPKLLAGADLENEYSRSVEKSIYDHKKDLGRQKPTYVDIININRRLIYKNLRCLACTNGEVKCFRYDWVDKKLL